MQTTAETARELTALVSRLRRRLREVAGLDDLTPSQTSVLSRLQKDGPAGTSDLARAERVRPQSMTKAVTTLERLGYVERRADPTDGRRQLIAINPHTDAVIADSRQRRSEWLATVLDQLTPGERRTVADAVAILTKVIDE